MADETDYAGCIALARGHYENFPVASLLLPQRLRRPIAAIYAYARSADDIADEGDLPDDLRLQRLGEYEARLDALQRGATPDDALFGTLAHVIRAHALPLAPFYDLLAAFRQDVTRRHCLDIDDLLRYCSLSANPVGRLLLRLFGADGPENNALSDAVCTGLQLTNFLQDVDDDYARGRIYLPQAEMRAHGVNDDTIRGRRHTAGWRTLVTQEIDRAQSHLLRGAPLATRLPGRAGLELRLTVAGGLTILDKLRKINASRFISGVRLSRWDSLAILRRSLLRR